MSPREQVIDIIHDDNQAKKDGLVIPVSLLANLSLLLDVRLKGDPNFHVESSAQKKAWKELVYFATENDFSSAMDEFMEWAVAIEAWIVGDQYDIQSFQHRAEAYMNQNFCEEAIEEIALEEIERAFRGTAPGSELRLIMARVLAVRVDAELDYGGQLKDLPEISHFFDISGFQDEFMAAVKQAGGRAKKRRRLQ